MKTFVCLGHVSLCHVSLCHVNPYHVNPYHVTPVRPCHVTAKVADYLHMSHLAEAGSTKAAEADHLQAEGVHVQDRSHVQGRGHVQDRRHVVSRHVVYLSHVTNPLSHLPEQEEDLWEDHVCHVCHVAPYHVTLYLAL